MGLFGKKKKPVKASEGAVDQRGGQGHSSSLDGLLGVETNVVFALDWGPSCARGARTFHGLHLHAVGGPLNPFEATIGALGGALQGACRGEDGGRWNAFGFGDASTEDFGVFGFWRGEGGERAAAPSG